MWCGYAAGDLYYSKAPKGKATDDDGFCRVLAELDGHCGKTHFFN